MKHKSSLLTSTLTPPSLPVPENAKLFAWVGDEIVPREMAKVLEPYMDLCLLFVTCLFMFLLSNSDVIFLHSCLRFLFLTRSCKAVTLYGKVFEFTKGKYSSLKNILTGKKQVRRKPEHFFEIVLLIC